MRSAILAILLAANLAAAEGDAVARRFWVGGYGDAIAWCVLYGDGRIERLGAIAGCANPSFLAVAPDGGRLYAISEGAPGRVVAFAVDRSTAALTRLNDATSGGAGPCHIAVDAGGGWITVANYGSGGAALLAATEAGVAEPAAVVATAAEAHMALPHAGRLHVPVKSSDEVLGFAMRDGALAAEPQVARFGAGSGPRHIAFHPTLAVAYVIGEHDDTITRCAIAADGALQPGTTSTTLPGDADAAANYCAHLVVHPSGRFLYASNRGHDSIAQFAIDDAGALTPIGHTGAGAVTWPRHFALDPSGRWLVVANERAGTLSVFAVDGERGTLTAGERFACGGKPACVVFAP
ncbi:MAG TPA: beta-propeller fold lactonase family protein [Planctomycetota bacterium]|nr:beta-propeller fold lactonase family protein [Planctomycetota bacterium]